MKKHTIALLLALALVFGVSVPASAAGSHSVVFFTDSTKKVVHDTQQVPHKGHPIRPAAPADFVRNGIRYSFGDWYWDVMGNAVVFDFEDDVCEIWGDAVIYAGYVEYLAPGYELIVVHSGGTDFITDTETPIQVILKRYSGVSSWVPYSKDSYEHGTGGDLIASGTEGGQEKEYESLADAVSHVDADSEIALLADAILNSELQINKSLSIALSGYTLNAAQGLTLENATLTLNGEADGSRLKGTITVSDGARLTITGGDCTELTLSVNDSGAVSITGGSFGFDPSEYLEPSAYEAHESNGVYTVTAHTHSYDYSAPSWKWKIENGASVAEVSYSCACGTCDTLTVTPVYTDSKGVRSYTATDSHGNSDSMTKTMEYSVSLNGEANDKLYHWGEICSLTVDAYSAWYLDSADPDNLLADGVKTYLFAVTEHNHLVTETSAYQSQRPTVKTTISSNAPGTAAFHARWSLPNGAQVQSVTIYRGFTRSDADITTDTLTRRGTACNVELFARSGDYTLRLQNLSSGTYQHAVVVIRYELDGVAQEPLVSSVQKTLVA